VFLVAASAKFQLAASIGGSVLGLIEMGNSMAESDATGAALAYGGKTASTAEGVAARNSGMLKIAKRAGVIFTVSSFGRTVAQVSKDTSACIESNR
jgi:hypothetical protein